MVRPQPGARLFRAAAIPAVDVAGDRVAHLVATVAAPEAAGTTEWFGAVLSLMSEPVDDLYAAIHTEGACRGCGPELWFPDGTTGAHATAAAAAQAVCGRCPVQATCLAFALGTGQAYGVWGGTVEEDRVRLRRRLGLRSRGPAD